MKVYLLICTGEYNIGYIRQRTEVITGFLDKEKAMSLLQSGNVDVADPTNWGVRGISMYEVDIVV